VTAANGGTRRGRLVRGLRRAFVPLGRELLVWVKAYLVVGLGVVLLGVLILGWIGLSERLGRIQARQEWALVAFAAGGDPVELSRWVRRDDCEAKRQQIGRDYYDRGAAVGLKCQGLKSWWELLRARDRVPLRLEDLK